MLLEREKMNLVFKRLIAVFAILFTVTAAFAAENSSEEFGKICTLVNKDYKIYSIQVAHSRGAASNFESVDPNEEFKQTAIDYDSSVNVFVIEFKSDGKRIMIDCGFGAEKDKLQELLKEAGIPVESISDLYITHMHLDHVGGIKDFPKAKVHIAKEEYEAWKTDSKRQNLSNFMRPQEEMHLFSFEEEFPNGLKAIKCAGHTPGHTVYNIGNIYFIGDLMHAAELQYPHPSFSHIKYDMNREEAAKSRKLAKDTFHGEWFGAHVPFPGTIKNP